MSLYTSIFQKLTMFILVHVYTFLVYKEKAKHEIFNEKLQNIEQKCFKKIMNTYSCFENGKMCGLYFVLKYSEIYIFNKFQNQDYYY